MKHCFYGAYVRVGRQTKWVWKNELYGILGKKIEIIWEVGEVNILGKVACQVSIEKATFKTWLHQGYTAARATQTGGIASGKALRQEHA